ncbi:MAG: hypothetical protein QW259_03975 [Pyrobaculum sp.]
MARGAESSLKTLAEARRGLRRSGRGRVELRPRGECAVYYRARRWG